MGFRFRKRIRIVPGVFWERREESSAHLHFLPFHALSASWWLSRLGRSPPGRSEALGQTS
jgi:hypothetical protein